MDFIKKPIDFDNLQGFAAPYGFNTDEYHAEVAKIWAGVTKMKEVKKLPEKLGYTE